MAGFRLDIVASLARQLAFAPSDVRGAQLAAAEELMNDLDAARSYPAAFVVYRVTGYHPKLGVADETLTGLALQHDLGLLIEQVSDGLDLRAGEQPEPVLSIDDVTERFNVTSKTIQRWRKRGLVSRRFIFGDGRRRVGFLLSSIERFVGRHSEDVRGEANLTRVERNEVVAIVAAARRLVAVHRFDEATLTQRLARRFRRSALTVLHTLRKHDQASPGEAVLLLAASSISPAARRRIAAMSRRGRSLSRIARRVGRSRAAIYRVLLETRVDRLVKRRVRFHDDELYHGNDAELAIASIVRAADEAATSARSNDVVRVPRGLPPYLADLYRVPLLTPTQERALFLQFHYLKFRVVAERRRFDPESARRRDVERLESCLRDAIAVKNRIIRANLRLVVSVARKHVRPAHLGAVAGPTLMELVSEGNLILMRAAESFDVHKNVRFSTYATFALMTGLARAAPAMRSSAGVGRGAVPIGELADPRGMDLHARHADRDEVRQMLGRLDGDERRVIALYYGLDEQGTSTFEQVGARLGLSKHRVRQIERTAMSKLRDAMGVA